jgi:hypothetical protein
VGWYGIERVGGGGGIMFGRVDNEIYSAVQLVKVIKRMTSSPAL